MKQIYRIAQFGAFDVNSYGDSLFPSVLKAVLSCRLDSLEIVLFSPSDKVDGYNGNRVHAYSEFEEIQNRKHFDYLVVGGGELFHFQPISFKNSIGEQHYEEGFLWKKPFEWSKKYNIPVIVNGVGVSYSFTIEQQEIIKSLLKNVIYFAVRDKYSYERMTGIVPENILKVIPDTIWKIKDIFNDNDIETERKRVEKKYKCDLSKPYIAVQYGTTYKIDVLIEQLELIKQKSDYNIIIFPINYSHEDVDAVLYIEKKIKSQVLCISEMLQPIEIVSLISNANIFVGTSLHGNLTAMRYNVNCIVIDMYPDIVSKIDGLFEMMNTDNKMICEPSVLSNVFDNIINKKTYEAINSQALKEIDDRLNKYFDDIADIIQYKNDIRIKQDDLKKDEEFDLKKIYINYIDDTGTEYFKKSIARLSCNQYMFEFASSLLEESKLELLLVINCPTYVELTNCTVDGKETEYKVEEISINNHGVYLERNVRFGILNVHSGMIQITMKIQKYEFSDIEKMCFSEINNKNMHIEQLIVSERKYIGKLASAEKEYIKRLQEREEIIAEKESKIKNQNDHIEQLLLSERDKTNEINNKNGHIEQLLQSERDLNAQLKLIHASRAFRLMRVLWKVNAKLLPAESKRRKILKKIIHPFGSVEIEQSGEWKNSGADKKEHIIKSIDDYGKLNFVEFDKKTVSIVIPVYNEFEYTYECLRSILKNSGDVTYEVIIADDCSTDLTTKIDDVVSGITVIRTEENLRFLRNCNNAAKHANGKYILFLNNDTQVQKNWLQPLVDLCEENSDIGMVGSKLIYPDGTLQEAGGILWRDGSAWNFGNRQDASKPEFNYVKDVDYISGASIMIRSELWKEIGGFDERFAPAYCEDSDLAFEVRRQGYRVVYQPLSVVVHFEGVSNGTDLNSGIKQYQVENNQKLYEKWKGELEKHYINAEHVFRARERSFDKKIVLFIDHYVPHFDEDAGSKTIYQYIKMFLQKGYQVKFVGDNFYQHEPYTTVLQQMGIEVLYGNYYAEHIFDWIRENKEEIDFVFLNRPHISIKYIDFIRQNTNIKTIYYGHDLHFLRNRREYELTGDEQKLKDSEEWLEKELYLMRHADVSYYPSIIEKEEIQKIDNKIHVKAITAYVYDKFKNDIKYDFTNRNGLLFVGGFRHDPNLDAVKWFTEFILPEICKEIDVSFYIVGSHAPESVVELDGKNGIVVKGFVSDEELEELYATCRMVVVPLRYGAGVKGKVVEAIYNGAPIVTTSVGAEGICDSEDVLVVEDDARKFAESVVSLYNDEKRLKELVKETQKYIRNYFSTDSVWNIISDDF